jgi:uncharacterized protein (TIGR02145 family)
VFPGVWQGKKQKRENIGEHTMKNNVQLLAAGFGFAIAFTFSCSMLDDINNDPNSSSGTEISSSSENNDQSSSSSLTSSSSSFESGITYHGEYYKTVKIGAQTWLARNLNYAVEGSVCHEEDPECIKYGRFYEWVMAMELPDDCNYDSCEIDTKHQGICPDGWHIPSNADWDELFHQVDGTSGTDSPYDSETAGKYLKTKDGWEPYLDSYYDEELDEWIDTGYKDGNGEDTYGFAALPGSLYDISEESFSGSGSSGWWWTASEVYDEVYDAYNVYDMGMLSRNDGTRRDKDNKSNYMFNVRCLKD